MTTLPPPLVSVIIPCYNVGKYIAQCLDSVLQQTYTHLEIWAINDESTDNTPSILDKYVQQYPPVHVIHKKNEGVSAARNTGLEKATGEYVMFVDGDDFLAPDCVAYFVNLAQTTGAEFCFSTDCFTKQNEPQTPNPSVRVLPAQEAAALLISPRVIVGCWNKMYKRSMLVKNNCKFATDLFYGEGLNFITEVAQTANKTAVSNRKVYFYRKNNAFSATTVFNIEKIYNGEKAIDRVEQNLRKHTLLIDTMLTLHRSIFFLGAAVRLEAAGEKQAYRAYYKKCMSYVRKNYFKLLFKSEVSLYRKTMLLAGCVSPWLLAKLDVLRRKRIEQQSVH